MVPSGYLQPSECLAFCLWSRSPLEPPSPLLWESSYLLRVSSRATSFLNEIFLILLNQCNPSLLWEPQLYLCSFWNQSIHVRSAPVLVCEVIWTPISSKGTQLHRTHSAERLLCDSILWRWFSFSIVSDSCNPILMSGYIIINMIWQWARTFRTEMSPNHPDCILCFR